MPGESPPGDAGCVGCSHVAVTSISGGVDWTPVFMTLSEPPFCLILQARPARRGRARRRGLCWLWSHGSRQSKRWSWLDAGVCDRRRAPFCLIRQAPRARRERPGDAGCVGCGHVAVTSVSGQCKLKPGFI